LARLPAIFVTHGGGPCFWMSFPEPLGPHAFVKLGHYFSGLLATMPERPKAVVIVSAHWEEAQPTVSTASQPGMLFDYYGFPPHTYELSYPAAGFPALAAKVKGLLEEAGISCGTDDKRGFDHGVFVPMLMIDPNADLPVVMLSLQQDLDPARHLAIGRALAPLREEGVLIIGSGSSFHNLRTYFNGAPEEAAEFDAWLTETVESAAGRERRLTDWAQAPSAKACHPREEHLLPLMVAAGAAQGEAGRRVFHDLIGGKPMSGYSFGD
jgi:aromatic ring-opening dioxygenase catalytic subunit (LigB family)